MHRNTGRHTHSPSASLSFGTSLFNDTQKKTKTYKEAEATPDERLYCSNMGRCRGVTLEWQRGNTRQGRKHEWLSTVLRCFTHQVTPKRTFFPASQSFINSSPPINTNERQNFTTVTRFVQSAAANTTNRRKGINRCSTRRFVKVVVTVRLIPGFWFRWLHLLVIFRIYRAGFDCPVLLKILNLISEYNNFNIIIGGNFNSYFDPILDRSSTKTPPIPDLCRFWTMW